MCASMFSARNLTGQAGRLPVVHGFFYGSKPSITSGKRVVALLSGIISKVVIVRGKSPDHIAAGSELLGHSRFVNLSVLTSLLPSRLAQPS